jgi:hypothetical protein
VVLVSLDPPESDLPEAAPVLIDGGPDVQPDWRKFLQQSRAIGLRIVPSICFVTAMGVANVVVLVVLIASDGVLPWLVTVAAMVWADSQVIRWFRALTSHLRSHFFDDLRQQIGTWLMPKNSLHSK